MSPTPNRNNVVAVSKQSVVTRSHWLCGSPENPVLNLWYLTITKPRSFASEYYLLIIDCRIPSYGTRPAFVNGGTRQVITPPSHSASNKAAEPVVQMSKLKNQTVADSNFRRQVAPPPPFFKRSWLQHSKTVYAASEVLMGHEVKIPLALLHQHLDRYFISTSGPSCEKGRLGG